MALLTRLVPTSLGFKFRFWLLYGDLDFIVVSAACWAYAVFSLRAESSLLTLC
jgi:Na+/melibiose symporter-like transporter